MTVIRLPPFLCADGWLCHARQSHPTCIMLLLPYFRHQHLAVNQADLSERFAGHVARKSPFCRSGVFHLSHRRSFSSWGFAVIVCRVRATMPSCFPRCSCWTDPGRSSVPIRPDALFQSGVPYYQDTLSGADAQEKIFLSLRAARSNWR